MILSRVLVRQKLRWIKTHHLQDIPVSQLFSTLQFTKILRTSGVIWKKFSSTLLNFINSIVEFSFYGTFNLSSLCYLLQFYTINWTVKLKYPQYFIRNNWKMSTNVSKLHSTVHIRLPRNWFVLKFSIKIFFT